MLYETYQAQSDAFAPFRLMAHAAQEFLNQPWPVLAHHPVVRAAAAACEMVAHAGMWHERPPFRISATEVAGRSMVRISVTDHGRGVPADARERIFEPFQQLGDRRPAGGVGLGLAVARGFVDALGGRITADTTVGGGLTVNVELPIAAATIERTVVRS